jgi:nucleoside-diphosphate-sugar epimerase
VDEITIIGCGDLGLRVARLHQARGEEVLGVVRTPESAAGLRQAAVHTALWDLDHGPLDEAPASVGKRVYYFAPPPAGGISDPRIERWLRATVAAPPVKIVYVSTSGVYGDCAGKWIDEEQPVNPGADRSRRRLWAERCLGEFAERTDTRIVILRVPGIYGPGRLPLQRLRRREPVLRESECPYTNRIHIDDLARVCIAAMDRGHANGIYNATDGSPSTMTAYFNAIADLAGLPRPPQISMQEARKTLSPGMISYLEESRRISSRRLLAELKVQFRYRDLRQGLMASLPLRPS